MMLFSFFFTINNGNITERSEINIKIILVITKHDRNSRLSYSNKSRLAWISRSCAEQLYWRNARGPCVIIKNVILTLLAWMNLHVTSQQTTPSEVHVRDFAWPPVVATFLSNFQSCQSTEHREIDLLITSMILALIARLNSFYYSN